MNNQTYYKILELVWVVFDVYKKVHSYYEDTSTSQVSVQYKYGGFVIFKFNFQRTANLSEEVMD